MLDLRATVYEREEYSRNKKDQSKDLRQRRGCGQQKEEIFNRKNHGIKSRVEADQSSIQDKKESFSNSVLERKAHLYDQIKMGEIAPDVANKGFYLFAN